MSSGGPQPYLKFGGAEIANAARTLSYLRRGLGGTRNGHWELGPGDVCSVLYRLDGGTCATPNVFEHPAVDPAPWYDPKEPGSTSFLGLIMLDIQGYDSTVVRSVAQRMGGLGGGTLAAQYRKPRELKFRAAMISSDDTGAEFGLRWLNDVLQGPEGHCDACDENDLVFRLACPPGDCSDDALGEWTAYQAALTDGPVEKESWGPAKERLDSDVLAGCRDYVVVEWTMVCGNPWLYKQPVVCLPLQSIHSCVPDPSPVVFATTVLAEHGDRQHRRALTLAPRGLAGINADVGFQRRLVEPGHGTRYGRVKRVSSPETDSCDNICDFLSGATTAPCCTIDPPLRGIVGGIFTLTSSTGYGAVLLVARTECGDTDSLLAMQISGVPVGGSVVVNCANHTVLQYDAVGEETDGQNLLVIPAGETIQWIEIADCDAAACICIEGLDQTPGQTLMIQIETQAREG